jgi:hypothetical protein
VNVSLQGLILQPGPFAVALVLGDQRTVKVSMSASVVLRTLVGRNRRVGME